MSELGQGNDSSPPAKRRFVVPALSQGNAIGVAQDKRGKLLFGRNSAAAASTNESVSAGTGSAAATRHTVAPSRAPINRPPATTLHASGAEGSRRDEQARQKQVPSVHGGMDGEDCATEVEPTDISVTEKTPRCDSPVECTEAAACHSVVCKEGGAGISATKGPSSAGREPGTHVVQLSTVSKTKSSLSILVNPVQRQNPILKHIRNVPHEFDDSIIPDYVIGEKACALFLSLRYHLLHPEYIFDRLKQLGRRYELRVMLVHVDVKDSQTCLQQLTSISILAECTLILAWSYDEAARYLETYKAYEKKPADMLKEKIGGDYMSKLTDCLTTLRFINKANVATLLSSFGTLSKVIDASPQALALCSGFGQNKANRLHKFFRQPFVTHRATRGHSASRGRGVSHSTRRDGLAQRPASANQQERHAASSSGAASSTGMDYSDEDDNELAPELEAILDVADVYGEFGEDDDDSLWQDA